MCHLAPELRPGSWGQSITHIGVPSVVGEADTAQLLYLSFLTSSPARLSEKRILTNRTLRFVIVPVSYLGDFLSGCKRNFLFMRACVLNSAQNS